jgi:hypothetical protein
MTNTIDLVSFQRAYRLKSNLATAEIQCLTSDELIARLWSQGDDLTLRDIAERVLETGLSQVEKNKLKAIIRDLISSSESVLSHDKPKIDRKLKYLLRLLDKPDAAEFAFSFLDHSRKGRRNVGYDVLKKTGITPLMGSKLIEYYKNTRDEDLLILVLQNPEVVKSIDYYYLLREFSEDYWRMRVLEGLLQSDERRAQAIADDYPIEFAWAVGRLRHHESLTVLRQLLTKNMMSIEFLSIYAWTIGKLRSGSNLSHLKRLVEKHLQG